MCSPTHYLIRFAKASFFPWMKENLLSRGVRLGRMETAETESLFRLQGVAPSMVVTEHDLTLYVKNDLYNLIFTI